MKIYCNNKTVLCLLPSVVIFLVLSSLARANNDLLFNSALQDVLTGNASFVTQRLTPQPLTDLSEYFPSSTGSYIYKFFDHEKNTLEHVSEQQTMVATNGAMEKWYRKIEDTITEEWRTDGNGNVLLTAKIAKVHGYRVELETPIILPSTMPIGYSWDLQSKLNAYKLDEPSTVSHDGLLNVRGKYLGAFKIKTPIGDIPAILFSEQIDFKLGLIDVKSTRYRFYSRGIGKVAEVEGRKVTAFYFYRDKSQYTKIIEQLPENLNAQVPDIENGV